MLIKRVWAMPNKWTFTIQPIAQLLARYVGDGKGWIDPCSGHSKLAEIRNDLNPQMPSQYHLDAVDFINSLDGETYKGVIFDPPYSARQLCQTYEVAGSKINQRQLTHWYGDMRHVLGRKIETGGIAITFGWNSIGLGKGCGFKIIEVLLVCHGRAHNDTIVTVERKIQSSMGVKLPERIG
jgi:hypothetical protein